MRNALTLGIAFLVLSGSGLGATVSKLLDRGAAVHEASGAGTVVNSTDYYGSGNDDDFAEYGVASFSFTIGEFGIPVTDLGAIELTLTVNDRDFTDGTSFELFLTTDNFDATYTGLEYVDTLTNGIDLNAFTEISSLGTFAFDPMAAGGTMNQYDLTLDAGQEASLIAEINAGSEFSIIIGALNSVDDITFTNFDDNFEPAVSLA